MRRPSVGTVLATGLTIGALVIAALNLMPDRRELRDRLPSVMGSSDPAFLRSMNGLYGSNLLPGNHVETLVNGDQIFSAMLEAIRGAETSINFETYVYWSGEIAETFADALAERARAGVEVRVLLDWFGSKPMEADLLRRMEEAGVSVTRFRPVHWYTIDRINNRTHRKLLIVDGHIGFTGGVGVADEWLGDARHPGEFRENHYRVTGPVVAMLQGAFVSNWVEDSGEILRGDAFFPELEPTGDMIAQLALSSTGSRNDIHMMLMTALAGAERHIRIATPYFIPDDVAIRQLVDARARGVEVDILLPGPEINKPPVRRASRALWGPLLQAGVRIHEYEPTFLHAKLLIVDDALASVGSTNFDERSFRLNDEANLNVFDTAFAEEQIAMFEADLARSRPVTLAEWQARSWSTRAGDWLWSLLRPQL
ncbi:phospholipase D-like domain-containing protein [Paracoccus sp. (in: a-proteobacteria)]|uniref:phospholipase D-like domain-containing protein n=1 Tax=Paracoccus sp. TaxID=267 RepID=UPI00272C57DF|nr:phospholipase D-like domain-containing protein [Paracoccus sp. (in: a-proteobacteria)]